jgi:group I intron endonuclease
MSTKGFSMMNTERTGCVYLITNVISGKVYVGQTVSPRERWVKHVWDLNNQRHQNSHLQRAWERYGADAFTFSIIEECTCDLLDKTEQQWMDRLRADGVVLYNNKEGGMRGSHTPETRQRIAAAGRGRVWSKEARQRMHEQFKGRRPPPLTEEGRKRISAANKGHKRNVGRKATEETRRRMSEAAGSVFRGKRYDHGVDKNAEAKRVAAIRAARQTEEARHRTGEHALQRWSNPEWRAATAERFRGVRTYAGALTRSQAEEARVMKAAGRSQKEIANHFGVSQSTIQRMLNLGETYKYRPE